MLKFVLHSLIVMSALNVSGASAQAGLVESLLSKIPFTEAGKAARAAKAAEAARALMGSVETSTIGERVVYYSTHHTKAEFAKSSKNIETRIQGQEAFRAADEGIRSVRGFKRFPDEKREQIVEILEQLGVPKKGPTSKAKEIHVDAQDGGGVLLSTLELASGDRALFQTGSGKKVLNPTTEVSRETMEKLLRLKLIGDKGKPGRIDVYAEIFKAQGLSPKDFSKFAEKIDQIEALLNVTRKNTLAKVQQAESALKNLGQRLEKARPSVSDIKAAKSPAEIKPGAPEPKAAEASASSADL